MSKTATLNQVRHLYISNGEVGAVGTTAQHLSASDTWGKIQLNKTADREIFLEYKSAKGAILRSDLIPVDSITQFNVTSASRMRRGIRQIDVTAKDTAASSNPIEGQAYRFTVQFRQVLSVSDASVYDQTVFAVARNGMEWSDLYLELAGLLQAAFNKDAWRLADVYLLSGTTATKVDITGFAAPKGVTDDDVMLDWLKDNFTGTYTGIRIKERPNEFEQGLHDDKPVVFDIFTYEIHSNTTDVEWAKATDTTVYGGDLASATVFDGTNYDVATAVGNFRGIAELEWFTTSLRGENDKGLYWPDVVKTYYKTDGLPETTEFDTVDIHFHKTLSQGSVQKSEKQLTIAVAAGNGATIAGAIKTAIAAAGRDYNYTTDGK